MLGHSVTFSGIARESSPQTPTRLDASRLLLPKVVIGAYYASDEN